VAALDHLSAAVLSSRRSGLAYFVRQPVPPFWLLAAGASRQVSGRRQLRLGHGHISFSSRRMKGWALGLNAAGGNIGVSRSSLLTPILMGLAHQSLPGHAGLGVYLQNAGLMWMLALVSRWSAHLFRTTSLRPVLLQGPTRDSLSASNLDHVYILSDVRSFIGTRPRFRC